MINQINGFLYLRKILLNTFNAFFLLSILLIGCTNEAKQMNSNTQNQTKPTTPTSNLNSTEQIIQNTLDLANDGKVINSESFGLNTSATEIKQKWGKPDTSNSEWIAYFKREIEFGLKQDKVMWVRSTDKKFLNITLAEVEKIAGKPKSETKGDDRTYIDYKKGGYLLAFVFDGYKKTDKIIFVQVSIPNAFPQVKTQE